MVSGLFEPIGHKKWPLKFHYHDFQEFVLGNDGRAYQNELRVGFLLFLLSLLLATLVKYEPDHDHHQGMAAQPCQRVDLRATADLTHFLFFNKVRNIMMVILMMMRRTQNVLLLLQTNGKDSVGDDLIARLNIVSN